MELSKRGAGNKKNQFCKGYYARYSDGQLNGRVARLLVTPLIKALEQGFGARQLLPRR